MSDLRTAAQQALEALEVATNCLDGYYIPRGKTTLPEIEDAITDLRAALAEPVQEPVAWKLWDEDPQGGGDWRYYDAKDFKNGINPIEYFDGLVPLYAAPPQRKPLTEEEIKRLVSNDMVQFARAIERAHGIV